MSLAEFRRIGHWPTVVCAFLYFGLSCMAWMLIGALGNMLAAEFRLSPFQKGLMVATPVLGGALLRIVMGLLTDRIGARRTALVGLGATIFPLLLGWLWVTSFERLLVVGLLLGVPGASFAAALPMASRWYRPRYQGLVLGITGAGNSGIALATFFGPRLAAALGWEMVFAMALIPVAMTALLVALFARDAHDQPPARPLRKYAAPLRTPDAWWFCLFYSVTFGGFVGLSSFLPIFFRDQYGVGVISAGNIATLCAVAGSLIRPLGGHLSDRLGGIRVLLLLYMALAIVMGALAWLPPLPGALALMFFAMCLLGMGNGAVFQLVPLRYPGEIGAMTGLVGAAGGIGGFLLPTLLGSLKGVTGSFAGAFLIFALAGLGCAAILMAVSPVWERQFVGRGGRATQSACLRGTLPVRADQAPGGAARWPGGAPRDWRLSGAAADRVQDGNGSSQRWPKVPFST
jgi:NNP family nitrate/nitrite transporter-like MFS transporter